MIEVSVIEWLEDGIKLGGVGARAFELAQHMQIGLALWLQALASQQQR